LPWREVLDHQLLACTHHSEAIAVADCQQAEVRFVSLASQQTYLVRKSLPDPASANPEPEPEGGGLEANAALGVEAQNGRQPTKEFGDSSHTMTLR
jgi:hypothetical protein